MLRLIIFVGILLFIVGIYADYALATWGGTTLIAATAITYTGVFLWLLSSKNRKTLMQRVPVLSSTRIGDVRISGYTKEQERAVRRSGGWYYSVMSFCVTMAALNVTTFLIHKSPLYQTAVASVKNNEQVMRQIGEIKGYSHSAVGVIHESGRSNIIFGVRGTAGTYWVQAVFNNVDNVQTLEEIIPIVSPDLLFGK